MVLNFEIYSVHIRRKIKNPYNFGQNIRTLRSFKKIQKKN